MKGDFTRDTFDPGKHFLRVLMQQGRVQVDADWNEQVGILLHYMQALAADLIGPHGGPAADCGFLILNGQEGNFGIGKGRYYVDGILCENEATPVSFTVLTTDTKQIQVASLSPDGRPFQKDDYVEIFSSTALGPRTLAKIDVVDTGGRTLKLNIDAVGANVIRRADTYLTQPYFPNPKPLLENGRKYLVYLDLWERHISHLEDESIREVALGGPDTASRSKVIWQVKAHELDDQDAITCESAFEQLSPLPISTALLRAQTEKPAYSATEEPCVLPPEARYRGMENRLYRVEIHTGNLGDGGQVDDKANPTFKWSRDNGSVILAVKDIEPGRLAKTTKVTVASLGFSCETGLAVGDWVEIVDDDSVLTNEARPLLNVIAIDQIERTAVLEGVSEGIDLSKHPLLRRWDFKLFKGPNAPKQADDKALLIEEGKWLTLENGIQIWFEQAGDGSRPHTYRTGDYWLIPARVETGDIEWPTQTDASGKVSMDEASRSSAKALSPRGVLHHYAPLAILSVDAGNTTATDCRRKFDPLALAAK
ncbi:DUF6519 domain-containing protein [Methylocaldum sp. MU1018]